MNSFDNWFDEFFTDTAPASMQSAVSGACTISFIVFHSTLADARGGAHVLFRVLLISDSTLRRKEGMP